MTRFPARTIAILLYAAVPGPGAPANAQGLKPIQSAGESLLGWLISLRAPLDTIVANERRDQLRGSLSDLSIALFGVEQDMGELIGLIQRPNMDPQLVESRINALSRRVNEARLALRGLGPVLREQQRVGGARTEELLTHATAMRVSWVTQVRISVGTPARRPELVRQGRDTLAVLRRANTELPALIARLR